MTQAADDDRHVVAARIADGTPVDWDTVCGAARTTAQKAFFERLRVISDIAAAHARPERSDAVHDSIADRNTTTGESHEPVVEWGPLRILEKLGKGSFGDVYRAHDPRLDRDVALKLLRQRAEGSHAVDIVHEARLMARVSHPNVVTIYGAERIGGRTGIWMELLSRRNLAEEVREQGPLSPLDAVRTAIDVAAALSALHAAGLLHRDVKPQNVLRNDRGLAVLTDFGTGLVSREGTSPAAGTPLYVAPEVLEGQPASVRSDIYSLGVLLYFLLTGRHPVEGRGLDDIRRAHRQGRVTPVSSRQAIPRRVARVVDRALAPDPPMRFETAALVEQALARAVEPRRARALLPIWALLVLVAGALFVAWTAGPARRGEGTRALIRTAAIMPPGFRTGDLAPSGDAVICSGRKVTFALCNLETGGIASIPVGTDGGMPDGGFAVFSPDGQRIAYMRSVPAGTPPLASALHIMNADGTGDRRIFEPAGSVSFLRPTEWVRLADRIVADLMHRDGSHQIVLLDPSSGAMQVVRAFSPQEPVQSIAATADARYVVYDHQKRPGDTRDLMVTDTRTSETWTLIGGDGDDLAPVWSGRERLFFTSDRSGTLGIWSTRVRDGRPVGEPEQVFDTGRDIYTPQGVDENGRRILYLRRTGGFDGYRSRLDRSGGPMSVSRLSPRALDQVSAPDWSRDGTRLAYLASATRFGTRSRPMKVVIQDSTTGREIDWPLNGQIHQVSLRWWPDQQSLVVRHPGDAPGRGVVEQRSAETGQVLRTFPLTGGGDVVPTPDGTALLYTTATELRELRLADMQDRLIHAVGKPWRLNWSVGLVLSEDATLLALSVSRPDTPGPAVLILNRTTGAVTSPALGPYVVPLAWTKGGSSLLTTSVTVGSSERARLMEYSLSERSTRDLGLLADQPRHFRVHPDGEQVVFSGGQSRVEFWWLLNPDR